MEVKSPYVLAKEELAKHIAEIPGPKDNPDIVKYNSAVDGGHAGDDEAWCSKFVNWCVQEAIKSGYKCQKNTRDAMARSWLNWGSKEVLPQEGDIVVYWRGARGAQTGHVGFFVGYAKDGNILTLGGNQNDSVCIKEEDKSHLLGFRCA